MVLASDFFHTFIHLICCKRFQNWRRTSRAPFSKCPPEFTAPSLGNWEGNTHSFIRLLQNNTAHRRSPYCQALPSVCTQKRKQTPKDGWRCSPQGFALVLRYPDSAQIFSDWKDWAVGGESCCTLNYLADSMEQIHIRSDVPEAMWYVWIGSLLRVKSSYKG